MRRGLILAVALLALAGQAGAARAQAQASLETAVKAAFLPKFAPYVQWPAPVFETAEAPVVICIVGLDPFGETLDRAASAQRVEERTVVVRRLEKIERGSGCHIAYLGGSRSQTTAEALSVLRGGPVLTVTDQARSPDRGCIHLVVEGGRVRFHIDERSAAQGGLAISSRLLALGLTVRAR